MTTGEPVGTLIRMQISTTTKVSAALAIALAAVGALGAFAALHFVTVNERLGVVLVSGLVVGTMVVLVVAARSVQGDLLAREEAERAQRASEAQVAGVVSIAADAIITFDHTQRVVQFNRGAEQIFGYRAEEMLGGTLDQLLPVRFRSGHGAQMFAFAQAPENARRMGERREISGLRKGGEEFPADASILKLAVDGQWRFTVVLRDITYYKRVEEAQRLLADAGAALTRTLDLDESLAAVAQLPVSRLGDACIVDVLDGSTTRRVASVTRDETLNIALGSLAIQGTGLDSPSAVVDVLRTRKPLLLEQVTDEWLEAHTETDEELTRWRSVGATSLLLVPLLARNEVHGVLTLLSTGGSRKLGPSDLPLAEELATRAAFAIDNARLFTTARSATKARDEMLGVVSHDLRNPVAAIGMCVRALRALPPLDAAAHDDIVNAIADAVEWMERLIRDLLDVANIEAGKLALEQHVEEVKPIVESAVAMFARIAEARGVRLVAELPPGLPAVDGDTARLVQALSNLLANAVAHTGAGGAVTVGARNHDGAVEIVVRDTGSGIAADELPQIFERHWRSTASARRGGSGLGLAIVRGIVTAHGGKVWAESRLGSGSSFYVTLPAAAGLT
jgi:PAS domain S-box-containing protein